ncbi:hypothetical protein PF005_g25353 [Phytophthora fragariae]|uniref:Secreted protein n=1 Tax=Phytophthora fragariae TaxID=53985 RepID=A0A6A3DU65_9STRA|nr:hypothetical protein PF009_g26087 [Phytophthora fragariae]KAE8976085.1 hypothetical protein PF011_g24199 [Phytophthora fragariae]KAE9070107.1 hypothetical protein PF010_g26414 [Phytophthora fragariae]KAE9075107.1 hypothetical protein PF007_g25129 [Phytophthora fragariae]KAE9093192.1 hypothetical protein PF006_g24497 [Phytophthora fragariae]
MSVWQNLFMQLVVLAANTNQVIIIIPRVPTSHECWRQDIHDKENKIDKVHGARPTSYCAYLCM